MKAVRLKRMKKIEEFGLMLQGKSMRNVLVQLKAIEL